MCVNIIASVTSVFVSGITFCYRESSKYDGSLLGNGQGNILNTEVVPTIKTKRGRFRYNVEWRAITVRCLSNVKLSKVLGKIAVAVLRERFTYNPEMTYSSCK